MSATANPTFSILGQGGTGGETYAVSTDYFSFNRGDSLDLALPTTDEDGNSVSNTPFLFIPGAAGSTVSPSPLALYHIAPPIPPVMKRLWVC